ncbi:MAG: acetyl-CoA carboxylase biotin carboxylase subunit [Candidatus Aureabacteria bacterium]|nr:acetyl-CoA carboxylase biotin carboxylase subunit [Candidatus Auribacterota bacterium]
MFERILIANRGEIAVRIIRACRELGIVSIVVYSEADANSMHVQLADEAICIGRGPALESYLNIPAIVSAAEIVDAEAIHPGYGFLAENAHFSEVCESCKIKFIGPSPQNIMDMGDKSKAKTIAMEAGVPTIPGSQGIVKDREEAVHIAKELGYPVLIKATAGGGGKGMRIAHTELSLNNAFLTAQAEAEAAFKNPGVYIEKVIEEPRHIEFQILADGYGNVIHLGERDCTVQRKHQKLIEESPSPFIDAKLRTRMGDAAVKLAKKVSYENAGTIEFLMDKNKNFYFMEMNTRIQVEHPVTEEVTGIDLIKQQILIAGGQKIRFHQKDIVVRKHAIEIRVNAEDWEKGFRPSPGIIESFYLPGGKGVRVDTHIYGGYRIPPYYDSMIAKLIFVGRDRKEALNIASRGLEEFKLEGIPTTVPFAKMIIDDTRFRQGEYSTHFVDGILENMGYK